MTMDAEFMAMLFHKIYEELAPSFDYKTREASAKPWSDVPENNQRLMIAVAKRILAVQDKQLSDYCEDDCELSILLRQFEDDTNDLFQVLAKPYGVRRRLLRLLYPELISVTESLQKCYWDI